MTMGCFKDICFVNRSSWSKMNKSWVQCCKQDLKTASLGHNDLTVP